MKNKSIFEKTTFILIDFEKLIQNRKNNNVELDEILNVYFKNKNMKNKKSRKDRMREIEMGKLSFRNQRKIKEK